MNIDYKEKYYKYKMKYLELKGNLDNQEAFGKNDKYNPGNINLEDYKKLPEDKRSKMRFKGKKEDCLWNYILYGTCNIFFDQIIFEKMSIKYKGVNYNSIKELCDTLLKQFLEKKGKDFKKLLRVIEPISELEKNHIRNFSTEEKVYQLYESLSNPNYIESRGTKSYINEYDKDKIIEWLTSEIAPQKEKIIVEDFFKLEEQIERVEIILETLNKNKTNDKIFINKLHSDIFDTITSINTPKLGEIFNIEDIIAKLELEGRISQLFNKDLIDLEIKLQEKKNPSLFLKRETEILVNKCLFFVYENLTI